MDEQPISVQIIGAPIACKEGVKNIWREIAAWAGGQLHQRFGNAVQVQYFACSTRLALRCQAELSCRWYWWKAKC